MRQAKLRLGRSRTTNCRAALLATCFCLLSTPRTALAQAQTNAGFSIPRYIPTPAGEMSFAVDHPWYSKTRGLAAGITFDYAHDALVFGTREGSTFTEQKSIIEHQWLAHLDLAASFIDRVTIAVSLPIVLAERGTAAAGIAPNRGAAVGDLRLGVMFRIYGQPLEDAFSIHAGADVWAPIKAGSDHAGDSNARFMLPKLVAAGLTHNLKWSATAAFLYRSQAAIGNLAPAAGNSVGPELHVGGALAFITTSRHLSFGPEVLLATTLTGGNILKRSFTSLDVLGAAHYNILDTVQVGLSVGGGVLQAPGTPDVRVLLRVAYAPLRPPPVEAPADTDADGILDDSDACVREPGVSSANPAKHGCPIGDFDHDGFIDTEDRCPKVASGEHPDSTRPGCPERDADGDGIRDNSDECLDVAAGAHPDPKRPGCPEADSDKDGVYDSDDLCVSVPSGSDPDADKRGCPAPDRDRDQVPDPTDACPDRPGAPDIDPKKNGCPSLVIIKNDQIVIMEQVFFATGKDVILPKSFPVLQAVASVLLAKPDIKHVKVEGHTDNQGKPSANLDLSERRAHSVRRWLIQHGIAAERLTAEGFGPTMPIDSNATAAGRAINRRVEFHIGDAPPSDKKP
jgi:OmpA-OmpF porin, OOP family